MCVLCVCVRERVCVCVCVRGHSYGEIGCGEL